MPITFTNYVCNKIAMRVLICALSKHSMKGEIAFTLPYSITMHDPVWYWYFVKRMSGCNIQSSWVISQNDVPQNQYFKDNLSPLSGLTWVINYVIGNINWSVHKTNKHTCVQVHVHECRPASTQLFPLSFIHACIYIHTYTHTYINIHICTYIPI